MEETFQIPRIIHFAWAGGEKLLKDQNIEVVKKWSNAHPEYEIYLWIDQKTAPQNMDLTEHYAEVFKDFPQVVCKDIEKDEDILSEKVRYEIDRIDPNYGASSDLLRYKILYKYGGAYFDSDVEPGENSLNSIKKV